jgi:hypothetical protein
MVLRKGSPLSIRFEESDLAKLEARAAALGVSVGALVRHLVACSLESEVEVQLEGVRVEIASLQNQAALVAADLNQVNENMRDALKAILCGLTGDEDHAREMADEVVKDLRGEE